MTAPVAPDETRKLRTLDDLPVDGKRVILRVDFNVSVGSDGVVNEYEDYRLEAALPTIDELRQRRAKIILLTHLGRPQEEQGEADMTPIRRRLEELVGEEVKQTKKLFGSEVDTVVQSLEPSGIVMLPNVRLDQREEMGNEKFAQDLAAVAEAYVNDAFSVSHRAHTSVAFLPHLLPSCAGRRTVTEVEVLN
ncbi:MAG: phosphoglycerate kinase, partial [Candidatus Andersenbacteria bacterium]